MNEELRAAHGDDRGADDLTSEERAAEFLAAFSTPAARQVVTPEQSSWVAAGYHDGYADGYAAALSQPRQEDGLDAIAADCEALAERLRTIWQDGGYAAEFVSVASILDHFAGVARRGDARLGDGK